jgi:putative flippase GtrA
MFRLLARQLFVFGLVGAAQVLLDWSVFVGLTHLGLAVAPANVLGRVSGACLGFWLNGRFTFAAGGRPRLDREHLLRFVLAWCALTVLSTLLMTMVAGRFDLRAAWLAKPAVEAAMAVVGFVVWRQWVFR